MENGTIARTERPPSSKTVPLPPATSHVCVDPLRHHHYRHQPGPRQRHPRYNGQLYQAQTNIRGTHVLVEERVDGTMRITHQDGRSPRP